MAAISDIERGSTLKKTVRDRRLAQRSAQKERYGDALLAQAQKPQRATIEGYDADSGKVRLRLAGAASGDEILADSISNGAIERGAQVRVQATRGARVTVDGMPR